MRLLRWIMTQLRMKRTKHLRMNLLIMIMALFASAANDAKDVANMEGHAAVWGLGRLLRLDAIMLVDSLSLSVTYPELLVHYLSFSVL